MAFNVGISSKEAFGQLKKLTPRQRVDYVKNYSQGPATILSMLTPAEFAELFPKYYQKGLPDVSGFREAISRKSNQKQDDINFGLSQGAKSVGEAEQYGQWRRRLGGGGEDGGRTSSTTGSTRASGSLATNQREAYKAAIAEGLSPSAAKILVANMSGESLKNPSDHHWDVKHMSQGIVQWDPSRAERIREKFGAYPKDMSVAQQTKAAIWEMKTYYGKSYAALTNESLSADQRLYTVVADYERPANVSGSVATRMSFYRGMNVDAADPQTSMGDVSRVSSKTGGYYGNDEQCVALSKHFSGLGAASQWKVKEGNITAGTVIATMNYGKGDTPGGKMARDMPDGKSHYHTGIALSAPNSNGDVLILEQFAGQPARVAMININNYRGSGERMGIVEGGEPNAGTMKAVELGKSLANPDQLALIEGGTVSPSAQATVQVNPVQQAPTARPTAISTEQQQQYPADQQSGDISNKQTATVEKADKSKKTYESYKFDPDKYWNEVKTKQPMADSMFYGKDKVMQETYKGFEEAQASGAIKWNKKTNELQILDPNHEKVQQIYKDMQDNNIDRNAFLSKSEAGGSGTAKVHKARKTPFVETYSGFLPDLREDVGAITGQWESGKHGARATQGVESISTGRKDPGGVSYGRHQLSSKKGTMGEFLKSKEAEAFRSHFGDLKPGTPKFNAAYQKVVRENPQAFDKAQHDYIARTHYTPFLRTAARLGYKVEDPRIQEAIWGGGVQFRNNMRKILNKASHSTGGSVEDQVMAIAKAKQERMPSIKNRYMPEAQAILGHTPGGGFAKSNVLDMGKYEQYAMDQKSKRATYIAQHQAPQVQKEQVASSKTIEPYGRQAAAAVETGSTARQAFDRMRNFKADPIQRPQPEIPTGVTTAPPSVTPETMQPVDNKSSMNMQQLPPDKPQKETVIDPSLNRQVREFPTASLERAMGKARGFETGTGADGHHHSTTSLGQ